MSNEPNRNDHRDCRVILLDGVPPEVRAWITTNFQAFRIDGFDMNGENFEYAYFKNDMQRFALYESMRRIVKVNEPAVTIRDSSQ